MKQCLNIDRGEFSKNDVALNISLNIDGGEFSTNDVGISLQLTLR